MKIIADTKQELIDAIKHYACLRLEFRSSVFTTAFFPERPLENRRADFYSAKH